MRKMFSATLALVVVLSLVGLAWAGKTQGAAKGTGKSGPLGVEVLVVTATVEEVDYQKRTLTLKNSNGRTFTVRVDRNVSNLDQIEKGAQVKAEFVDSVAVYVRKPDWPPAVVEAGNVALAPKGSRSGVVFVDTIELPGKVEAIDDTKRAVTLKGPEGNAVTYAVDRNVKRFEKLKRGEQVVLVITEAVAISLQKTQGKE